MDRNVLFFVVALGVSIFAIALYKYRNTNYIYGLVTHVGDGDGFKVEVSSKFFSCSKSKIVSVRLAGIDAPEVRNYNKPGQPMSKESKKMLKGLILGKMVRLECLDTDRYGRIIAMAHVKKMLFLYKNVNLEMVRTGMAAVYHSKNASYGNIKMQLIDLEQEAKKKKIGIWSLNTFEHPQEFKIRMYRSG